MQRFDSGECTHAELTQTLHEYLAKNEITLSSNPHDPYAPPIINKRNKNPVHGKGKSYADHVESGWGKYFTEDKEWYDIHQHKW